MTAKAKSNLDSQKNRARAILRSISRESGLIRRMHLLADRFVGRPYIVNSLIGGPHKPEKFVVNLEAFDCVTLVESILALARSTSSTGFLKELKQIRYRQGLVDWTARLHYFSDWMKSNQRRRIIRIRTRGAGSHSSEKTLTALKGLPARKVRIQIVPKSKLARARRRISNGSIVAFGALRSGLDFFHTGLLFFPKLSVGPLEEMVLYHASRDAKKVVAEPLYNFLQRNRMRGVAFAVPCGPGDVR
jgi:N-acetylmuramoyl-L-alanine amidase-like protein